MKISPQWQDEMLAQVSVLSDATVPRENKKPISVTTAFRPAVQWLVMLLLEKRIAYKVISAGAGVTNITTDTETCPLCKRKL